MENYFTQLSNVNISDKIERKSGLPYLSWAYAWGEVKKVHPTANYKVYEREDGCIYFNDGKTAWVKTGVTVNGIEHIEYLPIMDSRNKSIPVGNITSFDVNKAIQRSLTKAVARHGLGLYVYAGEDLPEEERANQEIPETNAPTPEQLEQLEQLGGDLDKIANVYKVPTFAVTGEMVQAMINRKLAWLEKQKQKELGENVSENK